MKHNYDEFYKTNSEKFKKYQFKTGAKVIKGKKYDFFSLIKRYANKKLKALDLGCGSGELTIQLALYFKQIAGIDLFEKYLLTARKEARSKKILNLDFIKADARKLPFANDEFDIIYCSRGPLSQNLKLISESLRVLKKGGIIIEETIGEKDKLELKRIFGRGQNYPIRRNRSDSIRKLILKTKAKLIFLRSFIFLQSFPNIQAVIELLERAPIIPGFDLIKDKAAIVNYPAPKSAGR